MAAKGKAGPVKVSAIYSGLALDRATLWGVEFVWEGGVYVAELDNEAAAGMIEAGRVELA